MLLEISRPVHIYNNLGSDQPCSRGSAASGGGRPQPWTTKSSTEESPLIPALIQGPRPFHPADPSIPRGSETFASSWQTGKPGSDGSFCSETGSSLLDAQGTQRRRFGPSSHLRATTQGRTSDLQKAGRVSTRIVFSRTKQTPCSQHSRTDWGHQRGGDKARLGLGSAAGREWLQSQHLPCWRAATGSQPDGPGCVPSEV